MVFSFIDSPHDTAGTELLGLKKEISALSKFILECQTPMTIAIQGDWGTGKTSMMKMIQKNIADKCDCVWFNTWQFSQFQMQDDVPQALLAQLLEEVVGDAGKVKDFFSNVWKGAKDLMGAAAEVAAGSAGAARLIDNIFKEQVVGQATQLKQLKEKLGNVIDKKLKESKKSRLVIFVDDLDRMNPGKAVELLEVIKIFLDISGCVFVLAVDYGVVSRGVREKYGDMDEIKGRSFFDKIIQLPFNLPVAKYTIDNYLKNLLAIPDSYVASYNKLAKTSVGTNPRTLKRMANILKLLEIIEKEEEQSEEISQESRQLMFAALCMQMAFETVYAQILSDGVKRNLLEAKSEEISSIFSDALKRSPGNKEELPKKLTRFFNALNEVLADMGENGWQQFCEVLKKSGITASGSQQPFMSQELLGNTFDPALVARYVQFTEEINERYRGYFELLKLSAANDEEELNNLSIPAIFGWSVSFGCCIEKDGINFYFWSEEPAEVKTCYKNCLKKAGVKFPSELTVKKGNAKAFMTLPAIPWKVAIGNTADKAASEARFEQAKIELIKWCDALLVPMQKFYQQKVHVIKQIQALIEKIENVFKSVLSEERGWVYRTEGFGSALYPNWCSLAIRKPDWNGDYEIELMTDEIFANGMNLIITQSENEDYERDSKSAAFFKAWKKEFADFPGIDAEEGLGRNEYCCAFVVFPEDIMNWTQGALEDDNFSFALDAEQEKKVLAVCRKCAEAVANNEALLEAIAKAD